MRVNQSVILTILGMILFSCSAPEVNPNPVAVEKEDHKTNNTEPSKEEKRKKAEEEKQMVFIYFKKIEDG